MATVWSACDCRKGRLEQPRRDMKVTVKRISMEVWGRGLVWSGKG